jgi:peptidyl-prolyl cis-trans isomerase C
MYKKLIIASSVIAVVACSHQGAESGSAVQMTTTGPIAETVNGMKIPQSLLQSVATQHNLHLDNPQQREQALTLITDEVLVAQAIQHESFASSESFQAAVEAERLKGVSEAAFAEYQKSTPIGDDMLKAEYDAQSTRAGKQAYDFGQLLFADEADALKAEGDIVSGKPFSEVFDAYRSKAKQAKVFSRVRPDQLPPPLAKALENLKNDESTKVPVKTEYGWHVVHLDIVNPYAPPPFEQVKEGIRRGLLVKLAQDRVKKLRDNAKIEYPEGSAPVPATPAAANPAEEKKG